MRSIIRFFVLYLLIPIILAALMSYSLWNYFLTPPSVDALANGMWAGTVSYFEYRAEADADGNLTIVPVNTQPNESLYRYNDPPVEVHDYAQRHGAPFLVTLPDETLTQIHQTTRLLGWKLYPDELDMLPRYGGFAGRGFLVQGGDLQGSVVLLGMTGTWADYVETGEFNSDDTYNAYHALFKVNDDGTWSLIAQQYFRFDSAGIEFAQFPFLLIVACLVYLPILGAARWVMAVIQRYQRQQQLERLAKAKRKRIGDDGELLPPVEAETGVETEPVSARVTRDSLPMG
ncbi:MAG: hypothetical protein IAE80_01290 [Anaerolinea sp.]|nr:hypothetical protein [Anaerolinea sp.]